MQRMSTISDSLNDLLRSINLEDLHALLYGKFICINKLEQLLRFLYVKLYIYAYNGVKIYTI